MRKIPRSEQRSAVENWMYDCMVQPVLPMFARNFSANAITGAGLAVGVGSVWAAYTQHYFWAAGGTLLKTWLDYVDGPVARCTNTTSELGDWLDHVSDWLFYIPMGFVLTARVQCKALFLLVLGIIAAAFAVSFGCQEKYYGSSSGSSSVRWLRALCPSRKVQRMVQQSNLNDATLSGFYALVLVALGSGSQ